MNFIFKRNLRSSFAFLHKIQIANYGRNVKVKPFKSPEISNINTENTFQSKNVQIDNQKDSNSMGKFQKKDYYFDKDQGNLNSNQILQLEILRTQDLASVFKIFTQKKSEMDVINVCTCFHRAVNFGTKHGKGKDHLTKQAEIKQMVEFLKNNIDKMIDFSIANFLSNAAKLEILDREMVDRIIKKTVQNNIQFNEKSLAFITWALAKLNMRNEEFLDLVAKRITNKVFFFYFDAG